MANETTTKFRVDISELKKGIQEANRQIKLANAEFKAAASGMDNWQKSTNGISTKISQLDKVLGGQKKILESYQKQLNLIVAEYGENSKESDEMRIKIANQQAAVNQTASEIEKYRKALKDLEQEQAKSAEEAEKQTSAYNALSVKVKDQQVMLDALKNEYKQAVIEQGKNSDAAKDLAKQIESLSSELRDDKKAMEDADKAADDLDKSVDDAGKSAKDAEGGFTILKGALADLASKAISKVITGLKDMAKAAGEAWKEFDNGRDTVIKLTGATGEAADALKTSYGNVSKSILADSGDIGKAIGEVNTRFGLTGESLEGLATQYVKFSKITDADIISSIDDTQKALSAYGKGVEDAEVFLDALAKVSQKTGVNTSTLTSGIISNATAFQEMGLTIEQAISFMGQLEVSGANSETVLNGMRKALKNSAKDGLSLNDALLALQNEIENGSNGINGLNAAYEIFGRSGDQMYGAVKNGTLSFRDLTGSMDDAAGTVNSTYEETLDATDKIALQVQKLKVKTAEFLDEFLKKHEKDIEKFFQIAKKGLSKILPAVEKLAKLLPKILPVIVSIGAAIVAYKAAAIIMTIVSAFQTFFAVVTAGQGVMAALNAVMAANPIGLIVAAVAALVAGFLYLWNTSDEFRQFWIDLWEGIKEAASKAIEKIKKIINNIIDFFKNNWQSILLFLINPFAGFFKYAYDNFDGFRKFVDGIVESIKKFFSDLWDGIKNGAKTAIDFVEGIWGYISDWFDENIVTPVSKFFSDMWDGLKRGAQDAWDGITSVFGTVKDWFEEKFTAAWEAVKNVFSAGGKIFEGMKDGIVDAFTSIVNTLIRGINKAISVPFKALNKTLNKVRGVSIAGVKPFKGLWDKDPIAVPELPELARGGVLKRGQIGLLEGKGAEAVIPLENNKKWINATARSLRDSLNNENIIGKEKVINNNYTFNQTNNSPKALSRLEIYRQTKNQLAFAKGV